MFENLLALSPLMQTTHIGKPVVPQMPVNWDCRQDIELNISYNDKSSQSLGYQSLTSSM